MSTAPARRTTKGWAWTLGLAVLLAGVSAHAHLVRDTAVLLDLGEHTVEAELQLPLDQLALALTGLLRRGARGRPPRARGAASGLRP